MRLQVRPEVREMTPRKGESREEFNARRCARYTASPEKQREYSRRYRASRPEAIERGRRRSEEKRQRAEQLPLRLEEHRRKKAEREVQRRSKPTSGRIQIHEPRGEETG